MNSNCKICNAPVEKIFSTDRILNKYEADYLKCTECGFIFIDNPFWLEEAYNSTISSLDTGILKRNISLSKVVEKVLAKYFSSKSKYLDFGAGHGIFVRLMRDKGYDFYWYDKYGENLYARFFEYKKNFKIDLITCFEVFEHLENPLSTFSEMIKISDSILISTELIPEHQLGNVNDWKYFVPETGQHISFYSHSALKVIAKKYNFNFYSDLKGLHLFSRNTFSNTVLKKNTIEKGINYFSKIFSFNSSQNFSHLDKDYILKAIYGKK